MTVLGIQHCWILALYTLWQQNSLGFQVTFGNLSNRHLLRIPQGSFLTSGSYANRHRLGCLKFSLWIAWIHKVGRRNMLMPSFWLLNKLLRGRNPCEHYLKIPLTAHCVAQLFSPLLRSTSQHPQINSDYHVVKAWFTLAHQESFFFFLLLLFLDNT